MFDGGVGALLSALGDFRRYCKVCNVYLITVRCRCLIPAFVRGHDCVDCS